MNLKGWRKRKKLTQGELSQKLGIIENTYQAYESGRISMPADVRAKITKMGFLGAFPDQDEAPPTIQDIESIRAEIRTQAAWIREEIRKEIQGAVAELQEFLTPPGFPKGD